MGNLSTYQPICYIYLLIHLLYVPTYPPVYYTYLPYLQPTIHDIYLRICDIYLSICNVYLLINLLYLTTYYSAVSTYLSTYLCHLSAQPSVQMAIRINEAQNFPF